MPVELTIENRKLRFDADAIGIGRAPENQICLPDDVRLEPLHATLKQVSGRWIIESREGGPVRIGDGRPVQFAWLNSGDTIRLTELGPEILFQVSGSSPNGPNTTRVSAGCMPPSPIAAPPPIPVAIPPVRPAQKVANGTTVVSLPSQLLERVNSQKPMLIAIALVTLTTGIVGWIAFPRSKPQPSESESPSPSSRLAESHSESEPHAILKSLPQGQISESILDPSDLLVLIGVGNLSEDHRPHLVGVGWLWNSQTAVIPRVLGKNLQESIDEARARQIPFQVCVIHGIALEVDEIVHPPNTSDISLLKLKEPAAVTFNPRQAWHRVTTKDVELMRQRGKGLSYLSFAKFPKAANTDGSHGISLMTYDPKLIHMKKEDAARELEYINHSHVLKPSSTGEASERGGLLVDQDQKIIGMTLLESSVVWTADLERVLEN